VLELRDAVAEGLVLDLELPDRGHVSSRPVAAPESRAASG
jgi:hypothetical protein